MNGSWQNWMTCLQGVLDKGESIPCCEILGIKTRYYVGYYTVVDCSEYVDKKGNKHQFELKLLGAKLDSIKRLKKIKENHGALVGKIFRLSRVGAKAPSIGDMCDFKRNVGDPGKLFPLVNYKGKKLTELWEKAASNPDSLKALMRTFQIAVGSDGNPIPKLVPFNYMEILKPMEASDMRALLRGSKIESGDGSGGGGGYGEAKADEEVPF
jgi:hypothetical protein